MYRTLESFSSCASCKQCDCKLLKRIVGTFILICFTYILFNSGPGNLVGIATDYRLDGPGSNPSGNEIFRPSRPALGPTQPSTKWVPGISRG